MELKLSYCIAAYDAIKKRAQAAYNIGNYNECLHYIDKAAVLACQIIWRYTDSDFEKMLAGMANKRIQRVHTFMPDSNRVVFFDSFGLTYILTIQYLKALVAMGKEVLYVYEERNHQHNNLVPVIDVIRNYDRVQIEIITQTDDKVSKLQKIYDIITEFKPSKIFTHINTQSAIIPVLSVLPVEIVKYNINLGDHLYWLGAGFIDYTYEFRSFGAVVSQEKRGLKPEQTLLLPYYPITEDKTFLGFPKEAQGKVVIFTGGDFYKTIDKNNTYWELLKSIINENPNALVLFAGKQENGKAPLILRKFIGANGFEKRIIPIGFRSDINEVFRNCDIYMGTCPMSGGLMSQYAAINAKPIIQYYPLDRFPDNETESVICVHKQIKISYTDKRELLDEAKLLINDLDYRIKKGKEIKSCMITEEEFNRLFAQSLNNHLSPIAIDTLSINYDVITNWWIEIGNKGYYDVPSFIFKVLGWRGTTEAPEVICRYLYDRYLKTKILNPSWQRKKVFRN